MVDTEKLNSIIDASGISKTFLAKKLGISRPYFYDKLNGNREFDANEINILCKYLNITKDTDKVKIFLTER